MVRQRTSNSKQFPSHHSDPKISETSARTTAVMSEREPLLGAKKDQPTLSEQRIVSSSSSITAVEVQSILREEDDLSEERRGGEESTQEMENLSRKSQWIVLALASGGCAAFNGVFAKLTTTELTTNISTSIATLIGLGSVEGGVEVVVRALFFALNLIFNAIMWTLFTKALARGTSTTQVSILNTSSNFMITAILGWLIFSESLPPLWFLGAGLLVAGNVIIGRRDEGEKEEGLEEGVLAGSGAGFGAGLEEEEELLGEEVEMDDGLQRSGKNLGEEDDILDMNPIVAERESDEGLI